MNQKIRSITVKNILDTSLLVHQMIFQNLSQEIEKEASDEVHVSSETVISRYEKELLNEL